MIKLQIINKLNRKKEKYQLIIIPILIVKMNLLKYEITNILI